MIGRIVHTADAADGSMLSGADALAAGLTSHDEFSRIMARGGAAEWLEGFADWVNCELSKPHASQTAILQAITVLQAQTIASIAAQLIKPDGDRTFIRLFLELSQREIAEHMARTRAGLEEGA